jgi:Tol biopolymer transport system component
VIVGVGVYGCKKEEPALREQELYQQTKIAFVSGRDGNYEIYIMNADGSEQKRLTNNPASDMKSSWSPDGKKIAFHSDRDGNYEIYVMNADGSEQKRLTDNPADDMNPSWSPFLPLEN